MSDTIFVNGLVLHAYHGVMPHEAKVGQPFRLDLVLDIDLAEASRSDTLKPRSPMKLLVKTASEAFCARRYRLVEAAAGAVADAVLERYPQVRGIRVTVRKPHAPIAATFDDVGVIITRARRDRTTMAEAFIALGGNVGDVRATFDRAIALLCDGAAVRLTARSSDYRTPPWGVDRPAALRQRRHCRDDLAVAARPARARRRMRTRARARPRARTPLGTARDRHRPPRL